MATATPTTPQPSHREQGMPSLFDPEELRQFSSDDAEAGRRIGKILAALFIYTVFAMSIAIWWTLRTVGH